MSRRSRPARRTRWPRLRPGPEATAWPTRGSDRPKRRCREGARPLRLRWRPPCSPPPVPRRKRGAARWSCARRPTRSCAIFRRAIDDLRAALALGRPDARLHNRLGILLADAGDLAGGIAAFTAAVTIDPAHGRAWTNLGNALRSAGRTRRSDGRACSAPCRPRRTTGSRGTTSASSSASSATLRRRSLRFGRALALAPDNRPALMALAGMLRTLGRIDEAAAHYKRAVRLDASDQVALLALAGTLAERDDIALAARCLPHAALGKAEFAARGDRRSAHAADGARGRGGDRGLARDILRRPRRAGAECRSLVRGRGFADVIDDLCWTNFLLAYQGEDDRELQARYAGFVGRAVDLVAPEWRAARRRPVAGPPRADRFRLARSSSTARWAATSGAGSRGSTVRASRSTSTTCTAS